MKIISGGQSGVDRAALDFAMKYRIPCGGWCPKGRLAEDGPIDLKYLLTETRTSIYAERTQLNVEDSDGTLIIFDGILGNGSAYTAEYALLKKKPCLEINLRKRVSRKEVKNWVEVNTIEVLNIAGPRESTSPGVYFQAFSFLEEVLFLFEV